MAKTKATLKKKPVAVTARAKKSALSFRSEYTTVMTFILFLLALLFLAMVVVNYY